MCVLNNPLGSAHISRTYPVHVDLQSISNASALLVLEHWLQLAC